MKERKYLQKFHQEHLLQFWDSLNEEEKKKIKKTNS